MSPPMVPPPTPPTPPAPPPMTPSSLPRPLTPQDRNSFAYPTMKDRVPVIICKVIDQLHRNRNAKSGEQREQIKDMIEKMSKLRYELQTNKQLLPLEDSHPSASIWNDYLKRETEREKETPKWFESRWMYVECYVYRRLFEAAQCAPLLASEDYFFPQKLDAFNATAEATIGLIEAGARELKGDDDMDARLTFLVKMCLWGNKCDLSISAGSTAGFGEGTEGQVDRLEPNLVVNQCPDVVEYLNELRQEQGTDERVLDVVMDNAGFELISDLVLCDFLVQSGFFSKVRLRVKECPWFVSDTLEKDVHWTIDELLKVSKDSPLATSAVQRWRQHIEKGTFTIITDPFWTYPHDYSELKSSFPSLYTDLSSARLVLFKGDLNYRKLVGDLAWPPITSFERALQGFHPAPVLALRTIKADVVTGLKENQATELTKRDPKWMFEGNFGLIQFTKKIEKI